jgi:uncharacterized protein
MYFIVMSFALEIAPDAPTILVEACKFDGSVHRSWECRLAAETELLWTFIGVFAEEIRHPLLGVIRPGTASVEYYWRNRCYNVFRFHEPEGALRNFYCNVNLPPALENGVLRYIDLDVDVLVQPDLTYQILDLEEFKENAVRHNYPAEIVAQTHQSLTDLLSMIQKREFPFDYQE